MSPALETTPVSLKSTVSMLLFQTVFYGVIFLLVFWIFTLNWTWLIVSAIVTFLQLFIKNRSQTYINFVLDFLKPQQYFNIIRHYQEPIPDAEKTMFTYHPHSVFLYGLLANANNKLYPNEKLTTAITLGSRFMLSLPIIGIHFKLWGIQSVDPKNLRRLMKKGENISMVPGGYEQATLTTPKQLRVYIKERKGFIKYALKYGYTIRPVIVTNEHKALNTFDGLLNLRLLLNKIKLPGTIYWSKYGIFFPPGIKMYTLVGRGLRGTKKYAANQEPNKHQINQMHALYIEEIKRVYQKNRQKNGNTQLVFY